MRLDKFLSSNTSLTRSQATVEIKRANVKVNGKVVTSGDFKIDENQDEVMLNGQILKYEKFIYIMLNKPNGVVSATEDKIEKTVLDLLPNEYKKYNLSPCGRLDKDTLGLIILTNDGQGIHRVLSPKNHVQKTYKYNCVEPLLDRDKQLIEQGIQLKDGYITKPCTIVKYSECEGTITICEGKYHEIKRMFGAVGNKIIYLERISFGTIKLDTNLKRGEFRQLTEKEKELFKN